MSKRPDLKRPGLTATGRQWQTIEALRADGWLILDAEERVAVDEAVARAERAEAKLNRMPEVARRVFREALLTDARAEDIVNRVVDALVAKEGDAA